MSAPSPSRLERLRRGWRQASWSLTSRCDLSCDYCRARPGSEDGEGPTAAQVSAALLRHGERWVVGLTGGEPLMHPGLDEVCAELGRSFPLSLDSNLNHGRRVESLARVLARTAHGAEVHATLHPEALPWPEGAQRFADSVALLRAAGVPVMTVAVLHPAHPERFDQARRLLRARGVDLLPKPFKGSHAGREYPSAYSRPHLATLLRGRPFLRFYPFASRGLPCGAGHTFVRIEKDGAVLRCVGERTRLGSAQDGFSLGAGAAPCGVERCPCFGHDLLDPRRLGHWTRARLERWRHHARRPVLACGSMLGAAVARRLLGP